MTKVLNSCGGIEVNGIHVRHCSSLKILGFTYDLDDDSVGARRKRAEDHAGKMKKIASVLGALPMPTSSRARVMSAIVLAREWCDVWACDWTLRMSQEIRKWIVRATMPYHADSPRATAMLCTHIFCGHRSDPIVRNGMRMISPCIPKVPISSGNFRTSTSDLGVGRRLGELRNSFGVSTLS